MIGRYILIILVLVLFFSCGPTPESGLIKKETTNNLDEEFDPMTLPMDDNVIIPEKIQKNKHINSMGLNNQTSTPTILDTAALLQKRKNGFRVQIYATKDREQAYMLKEEALQIFGKDTINVYIEFDAPYYKIRIGDCLQRNTAQDLANVAKSKGYNKAWIVKAMVYEFPELLWRKN